MVTSLSVRGLTVEFPVTGGTFRALDSIDLCVESGERLAVVGESGCGKSVLGHSIMRLLDDISETTGEIFFDGEDIRKMDERRLQMIRGKEIALIPQSPTTSFNPVIRIGRQIDEMSTAKGDRIVAKERSVFSLGRVGFGDPRSIYRTFPHRLSGGMCERAIIAMGSVLDPKILIADEPTKGLDPKNKLEILDLLYDSTEGKTLLMITHDYNAIKMCDRTIVMYSGRILEDGPTREIVERPAHPYTKALWESMPSMGMQPIPGTVMRNRFGGCDFFNRCPLYDGGCDAPVGMHERSGNVRVRCRNA